MIVSVVSTSLPAQETTPASESPPTASATTKEGLNLNKKLDDLVKQDVVVPGFSQVVNTVDRQESTVGRSPAAFF